MRENRIDQTFERLRVAGDTAFVAYIAAGDPDFARSLEIMRALDRAGVDVLELGVPFSDPLADGPVNQAAAQRALDAGMTLPRVLDLIREFRKDSDTAIVLFTYLNPVFTYGYGKFHRDALAAGADGILNLDLPPDEEELNEELREVEGETLRHIRLIAPTTPEERIQKIASSAEGFIYYVSREGVTGEQSMLADGIGQQVAMIKAHTSVPVCVGFGISNPEQARAVAASADGVVVGSAIVRQVADHLDAPAEAVEAFVRPLVAAVHRGVGL